MTKPPSPSPGSASTSAVTPAPVASPLVFIALDFDSQNEIYMFASSFSSVEDLNHDPPRYGFKVNLDSFLTFHPEARNPFSLITRLLAFGKPLFLDFKMWNGGRTMENIAKGCAGLGVDIINMYPHAGGKFMARVVKSLEGSKTRLFGLTVLTHYTDEDTQRLYGKNLADSVRMLSLINQEYGAHGLIVPGNQLRGIIDITLPKLCPAIRPVWYADTKANDQEQTVTPTQAYNDGAKYLVVGSPIRKDNKPHLALERILKEVRDAQAAEYEHL